MTPSEIYLKLIHYKGENVYEKYFKLWINRYQGLPNVICTNKDKRFSPEFCHFSICANEVLKSLNHVKVYIPLNPTFIRYGVTKIFDFLIKNNIKQISKVAKTERKDEIVIRLLNVNDAKALIDFINEDPYLKRGLTTSLDYAFKYKNVALAYDGSLSYNVVISRLIYLFQKSDIKDFGTFLKNLYNKIFIENINNIKQIPYINEYENHELLDFKNILTLLINMPKNIDEFEELFLKTVDPENYKKELASLKPQKNILEETPEETVQRIYEEEVQRFAKMSKKE